METTENLSKTTTKSRRSCIIRGCVISSLIACAASICAIAVLMMSPMGNMAWVMLTTESHGPFDREQYEAVVEKVRSMEFPDGVEVQLRGQGAGTIWELCDGDGNLKVTIETNNLGHLGIHGFAFSDQELTPAGDPNTWLELDVPGPRALHDAVASCIDRHLGASRLGKNRASHRGN
jgi:hypothetical protein